MAFTVAPTSGDGPYTLSADITDSVNIDGNNYSASLRYADAVGSCPTTGEYSMTPEQRDTLITDGSIILPNTISAGRCRSYFLQIRRVTGNTLIDSSVVEIDNTAM